MNRTVLLASQIIDGRGGAPLADGGILIEGEQIRAVAPRADLEQLPDARVYDLAGWTLLPGLMDAHIHLDGWETTNRFDWVVMPDALRALNAAAYAKRVLDAGFTCVRDAGSNIGPQLKQVIEEGKLPGPRMRVSVKGIYQTNGQGDRAYMPIEWVRQKENCVLADGPFECRRAVRLMLREGADFIKIATSGGYLSSEPHFTLEEVEAMCDEAHRMDKRVAAHALGRGIETAVLGGVDSIEHGGFLTSKVARLMAERDIPIVPTLSIPRMSLRGEPRYPLTDAARDKWEKTVRGGNESVRLAKEYGIRIALGTDFGGQPFFLPDQLAVELEFMVEAGLTPHEAIIAATKTAAQVIEVEDKLGTLEPGKLADVVGVKSDPLKDITLLQNMGVVIKGGTLIHARGFA
ncbi:MAG TPA: amidohydrolase family protein [Anaerolineae bacterium]|nr:amidohydrolase family protein [Anaerolineae bacterium]